MEDLSVIREKINELDLNEVYYNVELPLIDVLYDMEQEGFKIDIENLEEINKTYITEIESLTNKI